MRRSQGVESVQQPRFKMITSGDVIMMVGIIITDITMTLSKNG